MSFNTIISGRVRAVLTALLSLGLCSACISTPPDDSAQLVSNWLLKAWVINGEPRALDAGIGNPTLVIQADGGISGYASVNRYNTEAEFQPDGTVVISPRVLTTRRAGPPAAMEQERLFLSLLPNVTRYRIIDGELRLENNESWVQFSAE